MKKGDKVRLKKFKGINDLEISTISYEKYIGSEVEIDMIDDNDGTFMFIDGGVLKWWMQDACEPVLELSELVKKGDKVILKKFESNDELNWIEDYHDKFIGKDVEIELMNSSYDIFSFKCEYGDVWWMQDACELVSELSEPVKEGIYFYVGQTVYSPFFRNKESKGVVTEIYLGRGYPISTSAIDGQSYSFTLDGKSQEGHDFISLFQEPIIFPVNKIIEPPVTFEKGEIIEVSNDGVMWNLAYYCDKSNEDKYPYMIYTGKKNSELYNPISYAKVRKIKQTN